MKEEIIAKDYSYYQNIIKKKKFSLFLIRFFDIILSFFGLVVLFIPFVLIALLIKLTSKGPVFFKQERVGKNEKIFKIFKFRTMVNKADKKGLELSTANDCRITKVGKFLRKAKIDELPQLINVFIGQMSLVGPRPEVKKYTDLYDDLQKAVFLVKPGITDMASIEFRNENEILEKSSNVEETYIKEIMPTKIGLNLDYIEKISLFYNLRLIFKTFFVVIVE